MMLLLILFLRWQTNFGAKLWQQQYSTLLLVLTNCSIVVEMALDKIAIAFYHIIP